jgi:uncharacterized OB-fold protein
MTLLDRNFGSPKVWQDALPITNRYSFGVAGDRFFREIKDNEKIMGTYCPNCDHTYVPGTLFCERCLNELDEWIDVGITGEVHTFTLLFKNYDGSDRDEPIVIAFIHIADGGLVHCLDEVDLDDIYIGMIVEAVFKPLKERQGSILDIKHFKPAD